MHTNSSESAAWVEHCAIFSIVEPYALRTVIGKYVCLAYISASVVYAYVHDAGVVHGNSKQELGSYMLRDKVVVTAGE